MTKWEYLHVANVAPARLLNLMQEIGAAGWEVIQVDTTPPPMAGRELFAKRPRLCGQPPERPGPTPLPGPGVLR